MTVICPICGNRGEYCFAQRGEVLSSGQYGISIYPVMCRCSMIFLSPRWSDLEYQEYYAESYDELYRLENKPDIGIEGVRKNAEEVFMRINRWVPKGTPEKPVNILDIGSAYGNALIVYGEKIANSARFGIESAPEGQSELTKNSGGTLIAYDVDEPEWPLKYKGFFDIITLRHVFEHLLNPHETLMKLRDVLTERGIIYFAVPDMLHPRIKLRDYEFWWDYVFRVVHPYYYNKFTLGKLLIDHGFDVLDYSEENCELFILVGVDRSQNRNDELRFSQVELFERQVDVFDRYLNNFSLIPNGEG